MNLQLSRETWLSSVCLSALSLPLSAQQAEEPLSYTIECAAQLYEQEEYTTALEVLQGIDLQSLSSGALQRHQDLQTRTQWALGEYNRAAADLGAAEQAILDCNLSQARSLLATILENPFASTELRIKTKSRLRKIDLLEGKTRVAEKRTGQSRRQVPSVRTADPLKAQGDVEFAYVVDPDALAADLVEEGMAAIGQHEFELAQYHFSMASAYAPHAPKERIYIDARNGIVLDQPPPPTVQRIHVIVPQQRPMVSMNLDMGAGRLVGMNSFQFSSSPTVGVGGSGFLQLPSMKRTRIKTSRTMPVAEVYSGPHHITYVTDYVVLIRPRLFQP